MTTARIVLFDLGGVLLPFDRERRVRAMVAALGITAEAARAFMASDIHARLDLGEASEEEVAAALSEVAGRAVSPAETRALILSVFEPPNLVLWDAVAKLRRRVTVGGFSDNPAFVAGLFPSGAVLEPMFWSAELHLSKSGPEAFAAVTARLGLDPAAIVFVDDSEANVARAKAAGWDAIRFRANDQLIEALSERRLRA
ncbi:MAG TPA: HAD-IA family hydrolase [Caulobacteraceae bacterium]|nr:HAD-IA family hydrolase [Caulobacteraceae bacterium]